MYLYIKCRVKITSFYEYAQKTLSNFKETEKIKFGSY